MQPSPLRAFRWLGVLAALALFWFAAAPVQADDIVTVDASNLLFTGNSVCGPSGTDLCTEVLSGSFSWDNTTGTLVPGAGPPIVSGPLGPFPPAIGGGFTPSGGGGFLFAAGWLSSGNASINLNILLPTAVLPPGTYPTVGSLTGLGQADAFLLCASGSACESEFYPAGVGFPLASQGLVTITEAPEPPSTALAALGILALGLPIARRRRAGARLNV